MTDRPVAVRLTTEQQRRLVEARARWDEKFLQELADIEAAGRITERDLAIVIGPCPLKEARDGE